MKVLFTICGRAGSKGIKNKNIRQMAGKLLPFYSLSAIDLYLKKNPDVEYDIVVSTDSQELIMMMNENSMRSVEIIDREERLSGGVVGKIEVITDCLNKMEERKNCKYDIVVDLDITSPLRRMDDIENVINKHLEAGADVTTTVAPARRNPYFNQLKKTEHGFKKVIESNYTARQQAPEIYDMNASIYAYSPQYLGKGVGVLDGYVECVEMTDTGVLDLDHESDFMLMEVVAKYFFENVDGFKEIYENIK